MNFKELLGKQMLFFDGATGTQLQARGLQPGELPESWNFTHPDIVEAVHRSYLDNGNIQVAIFDNRLEITSPGKLPLGQTIEKMREGYSKVRNEALAMAFSYMHLIERWGTGMLRIAKMIREAGLGELEILGGETELRFNIYRKQATEQASKTEQASEEKAGQGAGQALESEEIILVDFLAKNPRSNIREIAQNLVLSKSAVDRLIKKLKTKKIIERVGTSQKGYWKVLN